MRKLIKKYIPLLFLKYYQRYKRHKEIEKRRGTNVICVICNSQFNIFESFGVIKRENARCYNCSSLERDRLLWKYLHDKTNLFKDNKIRVLHIAPEKMFYDAFYNKKNIEYIPGDLFPEKYKSKNNIEIKKIDITRIPYEDNYFDFIMCNHVLEHVLDDGLAMAEFFRVMKKGGYGIFQVPIDYNREMTHEDLSIVSPEERLKIFGQHDHVRIYGLDYISRLTNAGFNVIKDFYIKSFNEKEVFKYGFLPNEVIYKCYK